MNQEEITCPYCSERQTVEILPEGGSSQRYTEDCQVCCRPWIVAIEISEDGTPEVRVERELG